MSYYVYIHIPIVILRLLLLMQELSVLPGNRNICKYCHLQSRQFLPVYNGMSSRQTLFLWCVHEFVVVKTHYSHNQNKRTPQQQIQQMNNMFLLGEQKNRNMFPMVTTHNKICVLSVAMSNIAELCLYYIR